MTKAHWPAYAWAFPVGDGSMNVGYGELVRDEPASRAQLIERLHRLLPGVGVARLRGHRLPLSTGRPLFARDRVLLAGDAAPLINPLTGEGIYYAMLSGSLAGAAAVGRDPAPTHRASMSRVLRRHLRHTDLLARLDLGTAAARDSQAAFDRLVDMGLGAGSLDVRPGGGDAAKHGPAVGSWISERWCAMSRPGGLRHLDRADGLVSGTSQRSDKPFADGLVEALHAFVLGLGAAYALRRLSEAAFGTGPRATSAVPGAVPRPEESSMRLCCHDIQLHRRQPSKVRHSSRSAGRRVS